MATTMRAPPKHLVQQRTPRALVSVFLIALCFAASKVPTASSAGDSCSTALSLGSLVPFNTTGLTCFQAWPSQDFVLRFGKSAAAAGSDTWSFVLSAPDKGGYISIGFSPTAGRMVGSSAVAGWVTAAAGAGTARQYYLGGTSSRSCPPDQGKLALANGTTAAPTIVSKGSRLYLAFQLAGTPLTDVIYAVGPSGSLPGSNALLPRHQDMAAGTISLSTSGGGTGGGGGGGSPATGGGDDDDDDDGGEGSGDDGDEGKGGTSTSPAASSASSSGTSANGGGAFLSAARRHGVLALVSWGVLVPVGVAVARFGKQRCDPLWFYAHVAAQGLAFLLGVLAVVAGFRLDDDDDVGTHKAIGVVVLVCASLQVMAVLARPAKETKARRYWNWYHHGVGRAAVVLGVANVFYGFSLAHERQEWSYVYGVFVGVFAVVYLVLEEWRRRQ